MPDKRKRVLTRKKKRNLENGILKGIHSPYHRLLAPTEKGKPGKMLFQSQHRSTGLSQKEKSFLISSYQLQSTRYKNLKDLAANAIKQNKIFTIYGRCNAVRKALVERGWIEKIPPKCMTLNKIRNGVFSEKNDIKSELDRILLSNFVEKAIPNFIWRTNDNRRDVTIELPRDYYTMINKLQVDPIWTSKQGLCSSMKRNYWFHIEDTAEVNCPRSYTVSDIGEKQDFQKDYRITACTSLLKWVLSMVANDKPVFVHTGKISMNVVVFALNRCKEYLFRKQHKDIDCALPIISDEQWNSFFKRYFSIISKDEVFQCDKEHKLPIYLCYAKFLLKEIYRYRPQLRCEGCHNIWIIKPTHCSRGRGIRIASKLGVIMDLLDKANSKYVVQKYIEEPLLIHETKFDIRQYYLVTSTYPLIIWMYKDCYLKFSSQKYSLKNFHESIHLTNNAVQRNYINYKGRHTELPNNNMWDLEKYKSYLNKIGEDKLWENTIYPGMKKSIIGIMLSCQDTMSVSRNRFELYGCDFILDKDYKPWLIEINSCPDLSHTTQVTAKICPEVLTDIIKVVIDYANNPRSSTGKFQCIFRQPMSSPKYGNIADLSIHGYSLPSEYFYTGNIKLIETYTDPNIAKKCDIKAILHKLKRTYDSDMIMVPPSNDKNHSNAKGIYTTQSSESKFEMDAKITMITEEFDKLNNQITLDCDQGLEILSATPTNGSVCRPQRVSSITNFKLLLKKSVSRFTSLSKLEKKFSFSKLSDTSHAKDSLVRLYSIDKLINKFAINKVEHNSVLSTVSYDNVLQATTNIVSFIKGKEIEYFKKVK